MRYAPRLLLWMPGAMALVVGLWAGLARLGAVGPTELAGSHGALMAMGFLGTLISLERAVALGSRAAYLAPGLFGVGAVGTLLGLPHAPAVFVVAAVGLVVLFLRLLHLDRNVHMVIMAAGAGAMLGGAVLHAAGGPGHLAAWWWAGFLVLTIVGERIELNRVRQIPRTATAALLVMIAGLFLALVVLVAVAPDWGTRALGLALTAIAAWLLRFDVATRTIRSSGLTRFIAACLLTGYGWLAVAGVLAVVYGAQPAGPWYDAQLHAVFVGFVFSMIFGHAPVIMPAVLGLPLRYTPLAFGPLALLHLGLGARVWGDLAMAPMVRQVGATASVVAIALFAVVSVLSIWLPSPRAVPPHAARSA